MIIAGLGNPGPEYQDTRHNVGFWAVEALSTHFKTKFTQNSHQAKIAIFSFKGESHFLVKPQTFMNLSGDSLFSFVTAKKEIPQQVLVIVDDINLPVGKIRLRPSGSSGGHNGLKSVIGHLGEDFWRLRIGVGKPVESDLVQHVLDVVSEEEKKILCKVVKDISGLITLLLMGRGGRAMSRFNCRNYALPDLPVEEG